MIERVKFGLVGFGTGGRVFHAPLIASAPNIEFVGVVTTSEERQAQVAAELPGVATYDSIAALAADGVQAVAISTPAATHAGLAVEAIEAGLAVVVDKPFALDADAARKLVTTAEEAGVLLTVYQNRRWDSDLLTIRKLVENGSLGDVKRFESRVERWAPDRLPGAAGGGTLLDFGSHLVDQALQLHGPVSRVFAELHGPDGGLDDDFFVALHHTGGVESHLWGSWRQAGPGPRFRVTGSAGTFISPELDYQETLLKAGKTPALMGDRWGVEPEHRWGHLFRGATGAPVESCRGRWDTFYPAVAEAVAGTGPLPVDPWDSVRAMEILDAARKSALTGTTVEV
ncbi:Gfo/Idh/MocA family protein [Actinoplanes derwentensis]|uniref:Predicted dehydrogenase n=1 Tax=Actinoplanes derwentensis TaxID=113562 RepID=A0A1H2D816_9ACTN|nr:Gfo/Idh/MocA family oxidoreductase [Actinoplanes derwentensis]GID86279.1 oxidoreductase [Actinoplanes derwentensis]SDT78707.1 Predicted dehydrogenase [Actinoplanes derwentensis]